MFFVADIWNEARKIFGHCLEPKIMEWVSDGIELLSNKGEIDPLVAFVDLCVTGECITTPREVETILALNICGHPALGHDVLFSFHLNGPGDRSHGGCNLDWFDIGNFPTYRDISCTSKLIAFLDNPEDAGKHLRVFGFDEQNRPLRTQEGNVWRDGLLVPMIFGYALPDAGAQSVSRITQIQKDRTVANVRLSSFDNSTSTGTLLGIFEPDETVPLYRRFKISRGGNNKCEATWVRLCFRKRTARVYNLNDRIYLHSRMALILALRALKAYDDYDLAQGNAFEANATRLLTEKESVLTGIGIMPVQVEDRNAISDKSDYLD